jgi:ABC-2 type transport system ATP-binding protein
MIDASALAWRSSSGRMVRAAAARVTAGDIAALDGSEAAATLLRIVAALVRPLEGRLAIDGIDALAHPIDARRRLAYVAPGTPLPEAATAGEYLEFLSAARGQPRDRARASAARFGIEPRRPLRAMTHAEAGRLRLAAADATGSRIILLDRPYDALDDDGRRRLEDWLLERRASGAAVIIAGASALAGAPLRAIGCEEAVA